jgi:hypothetical protein
MNKPNTAVRLLLALGAYKPTVTIQNELQFTMEKLRAKRHKRPMTGRGNLAKFLKEYFDGKRQAAKQAAKLKSYAEQKQFEAATAA